MSVRVGRPVTEHGDVPEPAERAQAVLERLPIAFFSVDRQFRLTYANAMAEQLMQKPRSEVIGRNLWEEFPEAVDSPFYEAALNALKDPSVVDLEIYYAPRDMWLEVHADPVEDGFDVFVRDITERKKAEEALREAEARFRSLLESAPDAAVVIDAEGRIVLVNDQTEQLFGWPRDQLMGQPVEILLPERFRGRHSAHRESYLAEPTTRPMGVGLELVGRRKDGAEFPVDVALAPVATDRGRLAMAFVRDVTERKRTEEALRRKDTILEAVRYAAGRFLKDTSWTDGIDEVLAQLGEATGVSRAYVFQNHRADDGSVRHSQRYEWVSEGIAALIDDPLLQDFSFHEHGTGRWEEVLNRGEVISGHVRSFPDGERKVLEVQDIVSITVVPIFGGEEWWGFIGFDECAAEREWSGAEIDALKAAANALGAAIERRQAEERIREAEAGFRTLVEQIPAITYVAKPDEKSTKLYVSPQIETVLGYRAEDWVSDPEAWIRAVHPDDLDRVLSEMTRSHETGEPFSQALRFVAADGRVVWVQDESVVIGDAEGRPKFVQGVLFDVTERRKLEEAGRRSAELLHASLESTADGILVVGRDGEMIFSNAEFTTMWRIPDELVETRSDERLLAFVLDQLEEPEAFLAKVQELYQTSLESFDTLSFKDGRVFERFSRPLTHEGDVAGRVWSFRDVTDRRRSEDALRKSEDHLTRIVETIVEGIIIFDLEGRITFANKAAARILGVSRDGMVGRRFDDPIWRLTTPDGKPIAARDRPVAEVTKTGRPLFDVQISRERPDGTRPVWSTNAVPLHDANGALAGVLLSLRDVSEAKGAEEELRAAEAKYRTLVENLPGVVYLEPPGAGTEDLYVSPQVRTMLGCEPEEFGSRDFWTAHVHPEDRERVLAEDHRTDETGEPFRCEYRYVRDDGRTVWVRDEAVLVRDEKGRPVFWQGVILDVTDRKKAEETARQSEERYRSIFENAVEGIFQTTLDGRYLAANHALARMLGFDSPEELMASVTDVRELYIEPGGRDDFIARMQEHGALVVFEYQVYRRDGSAIWVSEKVRALRDPTGRLVGFEGTSLDVTQRKKAEQQLEASYEALRRTDQDRRALLSRLASAQEDERKRIAADIHDDSIQKMAAVGLRLEALRRGIDQPCRMKMLDQLQETVELSIRRLRRLMFELRPPALDRDGLAAALRQHLDEVAKEGELETHLENGLITEPPSVTRAIAYRITQEALVNVRKHAGARRVDILLASRDGGLFVRIKDDGVGIAKAETPTAGHLGLSAMRERAELAGGWWQLGSAPGGGTSVEFWLPVAAEEAAAATT